MIDFLKGTVTPKDWMMNGAFLAFTVVLCALFYLVIFQNQQSSLNNTRTQIAQQQKNLQEAQKKADNIEAIRQETAQVEKLVADFEERLPTKEDSPKLNGSG